MKKHVLYICVMLMLTAPASAQDSTLTGIIKSKNDLWSQPSTLSTKTGSVTGGEKVTLYKPVVKFMVLVEGESGQRGWVWLNAISGGEDIDQMIEEFRANSAAEKQKDYEAFLRALEENSIPISIENFAFSRNSANGISPQIKLTNRSGRRIKYIGLSFTGFNAVGDAVSGTINGRTTHDVRLVGPIEPGQDGTYDFGDDPVFYHPTVACIELIGVVVEFMDGSDTVSISPKDARWVPSQFHALGECRDV